PAQSGKRRRVALDAGQSIPTATGNIPGHCCIAGDLSGSAGAALFIQGDFYLTPALLQTGVFPNPRALAVGLVLLLVAVAWLILSLVRKFFKDARDARKNEMNAAP